MSYSNINKSTDYFNTKLYTGNNSTNAITGIGHKPDLVWVKKRNASADHILFDAVRGVQKGIFSSRNSAEETEGGTRGLNAFNSDGFTLGAEVTQMSGSCNDNNDTYASWNWKAGTTSGLSGGTITPSSYSINATSGVGIYTYAGTGSAGTITHGLGSTPKMIIVKNINSPESWRIYHSSLGATKNMILNSTGSVNTGSTYWNNTEPTNSVFTVGTAGGTNESGDTYVAYAFAEKQGYSKFGSYVGNSGNNADAPFIYTGFKTAFFLVKNTAQASAWEMYDNKRLGYNPNNYQLRANENAAEGATSDYVDFLSNGFKIRHQGGGINETGDTFIYMAFAEAPLVGSNNVPATAR